MPGETRKVRPGLVGTALRAVPKMKLNMGRLGNASLPPLGSWDFPGIWILDSSPCDVVTPHPRPFSAHLSRAFPGAAEFPRAAFRFSN
jgi:hypothetical protein